MCSRCAPMGVLCRDSAINPALIWVADSDVAAGARAGADRGRPYYHFRGTLGAPFALQSAINPLSIPQLFDCFSGTVGTSMPAHKLA